MDPVLGEFTKKIAGNFRTAISGNMSGIMSSSVSYKAIFFSACAVHFS
jgi:hypothetical protein